MTRDASDLTSMAFMKMPTLFSSFMRLTMLLLYQVAMPIALGKSLTITQALVRFGPAFAFPMVLISFLRYRTKTTEKALEAQHSAQNAMVQHVKMAIANFEIVRDYRKRGATIEQFEEKIRAFNGRFASTAAINVNNNKFAAWCTLGLTSIWIQIGGMQVASGTLALGEFLNYLSIFAALGAMWGQVYSLLLSIQAAFASLETICRYMNGDVEDEARMFTSTSNRRHCHAAMMEVEKEALEGDPADLIPIKFDALHFRYKDQGGIGAELKPSTAILPQGGLYVLVGPPSQGKRTILKLLGDVLLPPCPGVAKVDSEGSGALMIPGHLRVIHVSKDPLFVEGSLLTNLTYGVQNGSSDGSLERVVAICRRLLLSDTLMQMLTKDFSTSWKTILSSTDQALLHIARALIANPDVLCIHKPTLFLNEKMGDLVYEILQEYVLNRGLEMDSNPYAFHTRRPRTVIVTARRVAGTGAKVADIVFNVSSELGMMAINKQ
ncbi:unnamed protein product [Polarella glacialis]|uniref:ABC transporter domain-containing protein n=1 Tax=Polarella glacialis TaxID=89957 RepID=A0A813JVS3_POLGL|nr:unnamed protein product [Polarella glacialis]CAE8690539.1 unnamed protein product [Polarella glacialis]